MGQYLKGNKIGTCEQMYYMRLEEAQELAARGEADDDGIKFSEYLSDNTIRFRFAFPDEDGLDHRILFGKAYDKMFYIPAGNLEDVGHDTICVSNQGEHGSNMNIMLPYPHSEDFKDLLSTGKLKTSIGGAGEQFLGVVFQAMRDGKEKTIFKCARCGHQQRFTDDDIAKLKERATEYFKYLNPEGKENIWSENEYSANKEKFEYTMKIVERIR